jgi:hypothetical protein
MTRDFFSPTPEEQNVVLNIAILRKAEALIESCQHCNPEGAGIPFDNILDRVTSSDPSVTDTFWSSQRIALAARVRFWKKLSLSPRDVSPSQSPLPLVRRLLEMGVRLCALR